VAVQRAKRRHACLLNPCNSGPIHLYPHSTALTPCPALLLQACLLGALSVLMVDRACRKPLLALQPDLALLLQLCDEMPGYEIQAWAAGRREAAAKLLTSLVQRDADVRMSLIRNGCLKRVLQLLSAQVGWPAGHLAAMRHAACGMLTCPGDLYLLLLSYTLLSCSSRRNQAAVTTCQHGWAGVSRHSTRRRNTAQQLYATDTHTVLPPVAGPGR
jgi:hypothetical protein